MKTRLSEVRRLYAAGDAIAALRIVARFSRLGSDKRTITMGWDAHVRPDFYRQLGRDPRRLVDDALAAMARRYHL